MKQFEHYKKIKKGYSTDRKLSEEKINGINLLDVIVCIMFVLAINSLLFLI